MQEPKYEGLAELFASGDRDNDGYIDKSELAAVLECDTMSLEEVFTKIDADGDGKISVQEFIDNLQLVSLPNSPETVPENSPDITYTRPSPISSASTPSVDETMKMDKTQQVVHAQIPGMRRKVRGELELLSGEEHLIQLYNHLSSSGNGEMLPLLEKFLESTIKDLQSHIMEKERLDMALKRTTDSNFEAMMQLEEEMEAQISRVRQDVTAEERRKTDIALQEFQDKLASKDLELLLLQEQLEQTKQHQQREAENNLRSALEAKNEESRHLRNQIRDLNTEVSLLRSEVSRLQSEQNELKEQLSKEKESCMLYSQDHDSLASQLQLLQDTNKKLNDTNDNLRSALEARRGQPNGILVPIPVKLQVENAERRSSFTGSSRSSQDDDEDGTDKQRLPGKNASSGSQNDRSLWSELQEADPSFSAKPRRQGLDGLSEKKTKHMSHQLAVLTESNKLLSKSTDELHAALKLLREEIVPGWQKESTPRGRGSIDFTCTRGEGSDDFMGSPIRTSSPLQYAADGAIRVLPHPQKKRSPDSSISSSEHSADVASRRVGLDNTSFWLEDSIYDTADGKLGDKNQAYRAGHRPELVPTDKSDFQSKPEGTYLHKEYCRRHSDDPSKHEKDIVTDHSSVLNTSALITTGLSHYGIEDPLDNVTPVSSYKLVLVGDAAVGKSSLLLRLCKNAFFPMLSATLGIDFQTKNILVDGKVIGLNIWDTAGQERFHSIGKSYFRRVDGILLVYSIACELSYLHIRDWLRSIQEASNSQAAVLLCGNKVDLRADFEKKKFPFVTREQGERLAQESGSIFMETSAKTGENVREACIELARLIARRNADGNQQPEPAERIKLEPRSRRSSKGCCLK